MEDFLSASSGQVKLLVEWRVDGRRLQVELIDRSMRYEYVYFLV